MRDPSLRTEKTDFADVRHHVERRIQDGISVEATPSARAGSGLARCLH
jgi:hypothetical protein